MKKSNILVILLSFLVLSSCGNTADESSSKAEEKHSSEETMSIDSDNDSVSEENTEAAESSDVSESMAEIPIDTEEIEYELKEGRYPVIDGKVQVWLPTTITVESEDSDPDASGTVFTINYDDKGLMTDLAYYRYYEDTSNPEKRYLYEKDKIIYNADYTPASMYVEYWEFGGGINWQGDRKDEFISNVLPMDKITSYYKKDESYEITYNDYGLVDTYGNSKVTYYDNGYPKALAFLDNRSWGEYFEYTYNEANMVSHVERRDIHVGDGGGRIPYGDYYIDPDSEEYVISYDITYDENGCIIELSNLNGNRKEVYKADYELFEIDEKHWDYYRDYYLYNWIDTLIFTNDADEHYISYINDGVFQNYLLHQLAK